MASLAIIGTGIAGLGCAHFLHRHFDLTLFEQNDYAGGHTNTVTTPEPDTGRPVPIDTGFMVFNQVTYPHLTRLFAQLRVPIKPTAMSFSVRHADTGFEFAGSSLNHLFAQRRNLFRPRFYKQTSWLGRTAWFVAIMLLGNIAMSTYCVAELFRVPADGRLTDILTRRHAGPSRLGPALAVLGLAGILLTRPRE